MDGANNIANLRLAALSNDPASKLGLAKGAPAGEAASKMEEVFASMLVKEMRRALPEGFFGEGSAGDIYSGWLDEQVGKSLADRDCLHLEEMLRSSIERKQVAKEVAP